MMCSALQSSQTLENSFGPRLQMVKGRVAERQMEADCRLEREQPSITHSYIQRDAGVLGKMN